METQTPSAAREYRCPKSRSFQHPSSGNPAQCRFPSTSFIDKTTTKKLYERSFHTPEYFCYDPAGDELMGWRINGGHFEAMEANEMGWLCSEELGMLGRWHGVRAGHEALWLRFHDREGTPAPTPAEAERQRAEAERARAEIERERADVAEAELARIRTRLAELG